MLRFLIQNSRYMLLIQAAGAGVLVALQVAGVPGLPYEILYNILGISGTATATVMRPPAMVEAIHNS